MWRHRTLTDTGGFSLVEVLVSLAILTSALVAIANLFAVGLQANLAARSVSLATILAAQKIEELSADTALITSPPDSLTRDVAGFVEYLSPDGTLLAAGSESSAGWIFVRRWSVRPSESDPDQAVIVEVVARPALRRPGSVDPDTPRGDGVHLVTIRRRQPS